MCRTCHPGSNTKPVVMYSFNRLHSCSPSAVFLSLFQKRIWRGGNIYSILSPFLFCSCGYIGHPIQSMPLFQHPSSLAHAALIPLCACPRTMSLGRSCTAPYRCCRRKACTSWRRQRAHQYQQLPRPGRGRQATPKYPRKTRRQLHRTHPRPS